MKRNMKRLTPALAGILAALMLAGCGISTESAVDSTTPEGLHTFGVAVDPSSQPSLAPEISAQPTTDNGETTGQTQGGEPDQADHGEAGETSPSATASGTSTTTKPTTKPSNGGTVNGGNNSGNSSPAISPPAPTSTATYDDVSKYMGKSLSDLVAAEGYPARSDYDYVDEEDPSQGEIGTLYFNGFTVTTRRDDSGEIITAITPTGGSQVDPDHGE